MSMVCLTTKVVEEPSLWHASFGHLSFDTLGRMAKEGMVHGLLHIKHVGKLCDSYLAGKQRRLPFHKVAKYRVDDVLELVLSDLYGLITLAMHGGRCCFLLLMDDYNHFMWLQLLTSNDEVVTVTRRLQAQAEASQGRCCRC
jgi:hypothetical protein